MKKLITLVLLSLMLCATAQAQTNIGMYMVGYSDGYYEGVIDGQMYPVFEDWDIEVNETDKTVTLINDAGEVWIYNYEKKELEQFAYEVYEPFPSDDELPVG